MAILRERPCRIRTEGQGHGLGAVGDEVAGDPEEIAVSVVYLYRRLVIHQLDATGTAVGESKLGLKIGDGGRIDAEAGRHLVEIDRDEAGIVQGDCGYARQRRRGR